MIKHSFDWLSPCANCHNEVKELWASTLDLVLAGAGLCNECHDLAKEGATGIQKLGKAKLLPVMKADSDVSTMDRANSTPDESKEDR